jgi:hypothetical protein
MYFASSSFLFRLSVENKRNIRNVSIMNARHKHIENARSISIEKEEEESVIASQGDL